MPGNGKNFKVHKIKIQASYKRFDSDIKYFFNYFSNPYSIYKIF